MKPHLASFAALLVTLAALLIAPAETQGAGWRWPIKGDVVRPFALTRNRFAAGQHRGIDIAATPGTRVVAACTGRVTFAGRLPGKTERGVTIACGNLAATHLELATTTVRKGELVAAGEPIGALAIDHLQLGARRRDDRFGYIDPLSLLGQDPPPPLGLAPPPRRPGGTRPLGDPRVGPADTPAPRSAHVATPAASPRAAHVETPAAAPRSSPIVFAGLAFLLAGLPAGGLVAARRKRRAARLAAGVVR